MKMVPFLTAPALGLHVELLADITGTEPMVSQRRRYLSALARLTHSDASIASPHSDDCSEPIGDQIVVSADMGPKIRQVVATTLGCDPGQVPTLDGLSAARAQRTVEDGLRYVRDLTPYGSLIDTLVGRVVLAADARVGASSSRANLGLVVMCPPSGWDRRHSAVSLVHEAAHQALFLADLVRSVFRRDPAALDGMTVLSAVRGVARPYDLAFHSAAVAVATAPVAGDLGVMEPEYARVQRCLIGLRAGAKQALTAYGTELLDEIEYAAHNPAALEA